MGSTRDVSEWFHTKRSNRRPGALAAVAGTGVLLLSAACGGSGASGAGGGTTVTLPVVLPLTGAQASAGQPAKKNLEALAQQINREKLLKGGTLKLKFIDNQSTPSVAVSVAAPYIGKGQYMINGEISNTEIPINELVEKGSAEGPVIYNASPAIKPDPGSYIFVGTAQTSDVAGVSLQYAAKRGWHRVAVITSSDPSGQDGRAAIMDSLKSYPSEKLVADEQFGTTDSSVSSQIAHVQAAHPDVIVLWTTGVQIGTVFQGMRSAGLSDVPTFMSYGNINFKLMDGVKNYLPTSLFSQGASYLFPPKGLPAPQQSRIKLLEKALKTPAGKLDGGPSYNFDGVLLYIDALNKLGLDASASDIRDYIQGLHDWAGIDGIYDFSPSNHRGIDGSSYGVVQYKPDKGQFEPAPGAKLGPVSDR